MNGSDIRQIYRLHRHLLAEGYWHRMIVVAGKGSGRCGETFLHLPWDSLAGERAAECDIFLCPDTETSMLDALTDAVLAGVASVAPDGALTRSILGGGTRGRLTDNTIRGLSDGLTEMLIKPDLRYACTREAAMWRQQYMSVDIPSLLSDLLSSQMQKNGADSVENRRDICYNGTVEPHTAML